MDAVMNMLPSLLSCMSVICLLCMFVVLTGCAVCASYSATTPLSLPRIMVSSSRPHSEAVICFARSERSARAKISGFRPPPDVLSHLVLAGKCEARRRAGTFLQQLLQLEDVDHGLLASGVVRREENLAAVVAKVARAHRGFVLKRAQHLACGWVGVEWSGKG